MAGLIVFVCRSCGRTLLVVDSKSIRSVPLPTPSAIIERFGGRCPYCGAALRQPRLEEVGVR